MHIYYIELYIFAFVMLHTISLYVSVNKDFFKAAKIILAFLLQLFCCCKLVEVRFLNQCGIEILRTCLILVLYMKSQKHTLFFF